MSSGNSNNSDHSGTPNSPDSNVGPMMPKNLMALRYNGGRRGSVSAEPYQPRDAGERRALVVIPKSEETRRRITAATTQNLLFRNLEQDQRNEVVDAMFEKRVQAGGVVIKQGDEGDNFYIVDEGKFDVFVNGQKVVEIGPGGSFGELALMYNTPRAATIQASTDGVLWAVDRATFRRSVTDNMFRKRKLYETFLRSVPLLANLTPTEVSRISDALEPTSYKDGDLIVEQGAPGDYFFLIIEGTAQVLKKESPTDTAPPTVVNTLKRGDYFGELALLTDQPRAATVKAVGPVTCTCLSSAAFLRLLGPCMDLLKRNASLYAKYQYLEKQPEHNTSVQV